ncbi:MAG: hypothetical protein ACOVOV_01605 [Dolichospermum sp.]
MTLAKANNKKPATLSVFGSKPQGAIMTPQMPLNARNNCQSGRWTIGDSEYGSKLSMSILKYSLFYGSLGQTSHCPWGQIWFVAESGDLPLGVTMCTYIKSRSLTDFHRLLNEIQAKGIEPANGVFVPEFKKQSGSVPDGKGGTQAVNYYSLSWSWEERTDEHNSIENLAAVIDDPNQLGNMIDIESTKRMDCLDGLNQAQKQAIIDKVLAEYEANNSTALTTTN